MRSGFDFQRSPTTTQSAVRSGFTLTTAPRAARLDGPVEPLRDDAVEAEAPRGRRASRARRGVVATTARGRTPAASSLERARGAPRAAAARRLPVPDEHVEGDELRRDLAGRACGCGSRPDAGGSASRRSRRRRRRAITISPSSAERGGSSSPSGAQLREVAQQRPAVAGPEAQLAAGVLEHAAEPVPLRARTAQPSPSGSSRTSSASIGGNGTSRIQLRGTLDRSPSPWRPSYYALSLHAPRCHHRASERSRRSGSMPRRPGRRPSPAGAASASSRRSTRASIPVRIAGGGEGLRPVARSCRRRRRGGWTATSCSPSPPRRRRGTTRAIEEFDPARVGILVGSAIGGIATIAEQQRDAAGARRATASRRSSSPRRSSTRRAARSRSSSGSRGRTTRRCRRARPARPRSARARR